MIKVGDKVVYSVKGVGQIGKVLRTETKTVRNKAIDFLVVKLEKNSLIVYLPKQNNDIKIRELSNKLNVDAAYTILKESGEHWNVHKRWDRSVQEAKAMLGYSAPLFGQAECIAYLSKVKSKRKLSVDETNLLQDVKDSFVSEVSEIVGKSKNDIETELNQYLN